MKMYMYIHSALRSVLFLKDEPVFCNFIAKDERLGYSTFAVN